MFESVCIIGTGLLGGSLARDLKRLNLSRRVIGVCRSKSTAEQAIAAGVVDEMLPTKQAVTQAELIVLATPMQIMVPLLKEIQGDIPQSAILTDVGSVKTDLYHALSDHVPQLLQQFVLAHPIAGGENSGVMASREALFDQKHVIVTETEEVSAQSTNKVIDLWRKVGAKVMLMSLEEHDAIFAKTSHLPHVIAFSLVNFLNQRKDRERLFELAAAGFYDFTRIASSDAEMWRDICITNKEQILAALDGYSEQLALIRERIAEADQASILDYFGQAKMARDEGLLTKAEAMKANKG